VTALLLLKGVQRVRAFSDRCGFHTLSTVSGRFPGPLGVQGGSPLSAGSSFRDCFWPTVPWFSGSQGWRNASPLPSPISGGFAMPRLPFSRWLRVCRL